MNGVGKLLNAAQPVGTCPRVPGRAAVVVMMTTMAQNLWDPCGAEELWLPFHSHLRRRFDFISVSEPKLKKKIRKVKKKKKAPFSHEIKDA